MFRLTMCNSSMSHPQRDPSKLLAQANSRRPEPGCHRALAALDSSSPPPRTPRAGRVRGQSPVAGCSPASALDSVRPVARRASRRRPRAQRPPPSAARRTASQPPPIFLRLTPEQQVLSPAGSIGRVKGFDENSVVRFPTSTVGISPPDSWPTRSAGGQSAGGPTRRPCARWRKPYRPTDPGSGRQA